MKFRDQLQSLIEKYDEEPIVHVKFKMTSEQYEILQQALEILIGGSHVK